MAFPAPPDAPLHERVTFPSANVELNKQAVGAMQAVISSNLHKEDEKLVVFTFGLWYIIF